jgi:hypothetical protein
MKSPMNVCTRCLPGYAVRTGAAFGGVFISFFLWLRNEWAPIDHSKLNGMMPDISAFLLAGYLHFIIRHFWHISWNL